MKKEPEIFFHIGLGKTGTTFLQYRVFPKLRGLHYIQRTRFHQAKTIIERAEHERYFLSYECDQQLESVAVDWAKSYPSTQIIIMFRRHDSWIASQFRRFVKNCHVTSFEQLYDLEHDNGLFKSKDLDFSSMLRMLSEIFEKKPIIYLHQDLKEDPQGFVSSLASDLGAELNIDSVDFEAKHTSYSNKQLRFLMKVARIIPLKKKVVFKNKVMEFLRKTPINLTRYFILFIGKIIPGNDENLLSEEQMKRVRETHLKDWDYIVNSSSNS